MAEAEGVEYQNAPPQPPEQADHPPQVPIQQDGDEAPVEQPQRAPADEIKETRTKMAGEDTFWNPFTDNYKDIEDAYGSEIALVLHCHLRGYDRQGEGVHPDLEYYDKYGAPPTKQNSWEEGYHVIERGIANYNAVVRKKFHGERSFPRVAGIGGGVHLYKSLHNQEPWNWTSWIPLQRRWLSEGHFFRNRHFLGLRGNEIQNNLWDYHPQNENADGVDTSDEMEYSQLVPTDRYQGGYWYYCQPFGRYLHIISLKSHEKVEKDTNSPKLHEKDVEDPKAKTYLRYNYIVHPLAYRAAIDNLPDNSVDAMQWCIINIPDERHFGEGEPWGEKCNGLEVFNDFTYQHSYLRIEKDGPNNSELGDDQKNTIQGSHKYYYWFDTYPMEFAVFLLDSALARGVYLHTMCANDAFFEIPEECKKDPDKILVLDPKVHLLKQKLSGLKGESNNRRLGVKRAEHELTTKERARMKNITESHFTHARPLPYGPQTSFGLVTLLDPEEKIKKKVFDLMDESGIPFMGLNEGEKMAMEYLNQGFYFATTGLHHLFQCDRPGQSKIPYKITDQNEKDKLCYRLTEGMQLSFKFLKCTKENAHLIWRYTIMVERKDQDGKKLHETSHGYFKLDQNKRTELDLHQSYGGISDVKWLYFTAISPNNPQHRAWFHAIKGPKFGEPLYSAKIPELTHRVLEMNRVDNKVTPRDDIHPLPLKLAPESKDKELDFALGKVNDKEINDKDIYVYFMQVFSHQQDFSVGKNIQNSSDLIPPRFLQSVHGYFQCKNDYPTRLNLNASWDKHTVKDNTVYFYRIDADTGKPQALTEGECKLFVRTSHETDGPVVVSVSTEPASTSSGSGFKKAVTKNWRKLRGKSDRGRKKDEERIKRSTKKT